MVLFSLTWVVYKIAFLQNVIVLQVACILLILLCLASCILSLRGQGEFNLLIASDGRIVLSFKRMLEMRERNRADVESFGDEFVISGPPIIWSFLIVLQLKSNSGRVLHLLIACDALSESAFHQLKIALIALDVQQYRRKKPHLLNETGNF